MKLSRGFTLVEIMIAVVIIGLLAAMSIPAFQKVRNKALTNAFVNDLRTIEKAIDIYETEVGTALQDYVEGIQPVDLLPYLTKPDFTVNTPLGGAWDWDNHTTYYRISVIPMDVATVQLIDIEIDDGDTSTGLIRFDGGFRYYTWNAP
jgi:prepilin-type N-terminal cleavage/methylation domain-containing protein